MRSLRTIFSVRSGDGYIEKGFVWAAGTIAYYWSSSGDKTAIRVYNLNIGAMGVFPINGPDSRYNGFSLRCLQK